MGGSSSAPPPPPDPAIARERARREAVAIGQADARRTAQFGANSAIRADAAPGTALPKPTETITTPDYSQTAAAGREREITRLEGEKAKALESARSFDSSTSGDEPPNLQMISDEWDKKIQAIRDTITPADKVVEKDLKKQRAVAEYINRTRAAVGVQSTVGGQQ